MATGRSPDSTFLLSEPRLTPGYRLQATVGRPLDVGDTAQGRRRIVALTGRTSADWQIVLPDGIAPGGREPGGVIYESCLVG